MTSVEYQTSVSILFVGYLLMQIPSNLLLNKLGKPALYLPTCVRKPSPEALIWQRLLTGRLVARSQMIVWGVISAATAACTNAAGLLAVRFFLGFVEAAYL